MYKDKYLKYKTKYSILKNQLGGVNGADGADGADGAVELHIKARNQNPLYPTRVIVPDEKVNWDNTWDEYKPNDFTAEGVLENNRELPCGGQWADPPRARLAQMRNELNTRMTFCKDKKGNPLKIIFDKSGRPLNCMGRTGLKGRGLLGKWGPNQAADPIVTRYSADGFLQVVLINRKDTGELALPGGMVDPGESVNAAVKREFEEEALAIEDEIEKNKIKKLVDNLFKNGKLVFQGYVDDPRNTDNAWMETSAFHFHCSDEMGQKIQLVAGDDATKVKWVNILNMNKDHKLYASHQKMINDMLQISKLPEARKSL